MKRCTTWSRTWYTSWDRILPAGVYISRQGNKQETIFWPSTYLHYKAVIHIDAEDRLGKQNYQDPWSGQPLWRRRDVSHSMEHHYWDAVRQQVFATSTPPKSSWLMRLWDTGHLSVGAQADSAHEYLLKQYLLTANTDRTSLEMCKWRSS